MTRSLTQCASFKTYAAEDGLPGLRAISPRLTTIWQALKRADAEVYYQRCADRATGIVALFCRKYGRTFVHSGAHDSDFYPRPNVPLHKHIPYLWGLRHADVIVVQSEQQNTLLKENFALTGTVLPNVYPERPLTTAQGYVLWVGNMRYFRRPLLALEVARQFPNIQFTVADCQAIHAPEGSELFQQVKFQCPASGKALRDGLQAAPPKSAGKSKAAAPDAASAVAATAEAAAPATTTPKPAARRARKPAAPAATPAAAADATPAADAPAKTVRRRRKATGG